MATQEEHEESLVKLTVEQKPGISVYPVKECDIKSEVAINQTPRTALVLLPLCAFLGWLVCLHVH